MLNRLWMSTKTCKRTYALKKCLKPWAYQRFIFFNFLYFYTWKHLAMTTTRLRTFSFYTTRLCTYFTFFLKCYYNIWLRIMCVYIFIYYHYVVKLIFVTHIVVNYFVWCINLILHYVWRYLRLIIYWVIILILYSSW